MLRLVSSLSIVIVVLGVVGERNAVACGGGVVTTSQAGSVGANAQRIIIAVRGGNTDVVTQVGVPTTTADYGVLLPVPAEPTLDPNPVASADLDALDARTAPTIFVRTSDGDDGGGCGCPVKSGSGGLDSDSLDGGARVSKPVTIGPVTAVVLTADTGDGITAWLNDNGFAIPAAGQPIVDAYAGTGRYFIAIRRSDSAATGGPTSVGVHFTMPGDHRSLPLRFARLGAAAKVSFTIFVVADVTVAPASPFETLTLDDLDATLLRTAGYASAVADAVFQHGDQAFVVEGTWAASSLASDVGASLRPLFAEGQQTTRLSTIVSSSRLETDVAFDQAFTGTAQRIRYVQRPPRSDAPRWAGLGFGVGALGLATAFVRRRRG